MRIATWNLNHRAGSGPIKRAEPISDAIAALDVDVVILTEYMRQHKREDILPFLVEKGWSHYLVTEFTPGQNSVLVVSKVGLSHGAIQAPPIEDSAPPNALHAIIPELGIEILGIRIPDYSESRYRRVRADYWNWFMSMAQDALNKPCVIIGDLNTDPSYPPHKYGDRLTKMVQLGWQHGLPETGWSYKGNTTKDGAEKRLDHAFLTQHFELISAEYVQRKENHILE